MCRLIPALAIAVLTLTQIWMSPVAEAKGLIQSIFHMKKPSTAQDPCVELLAEEIDWLEKHVDCYGTVVAKQPDVWGQARLTKHRQEFERVMLCELCKFNPSVQGLVNRSDQAFLANVFALSAAATGAPSLPAITTTAIASTPANAAGSVDFKDGIKTRSDVIAMSDLTGSFSVGASVGATSSTGIALEPTILLDQRARYLNHLHELRRLNEGDDISASPGYALYLLRMPISVLPGKHTYRGYGAEIHCTATAVLENNLLPKTFRALAINDAVSQLGLPVTHIADWIVRGEKLDNDRSASISANLAKIADLADKLAINESIVANRKLDNPMQVQYFNNFVKPAGTRAPYEKSISEQLSEVELKDARKTGTQTQQQIDAIKQQMDLLQQDTNNLYEGARKLSAAFSGPAGRSRRARFAIPPTQVAPVYDADELTFVARSFFDAYTGPNVRWHDDCNRRVLLLDVQQFLADELDSAYDLLAAPGNEELWIYVPQIVTYIRTGDFESLCDLRRHFYAKIRHADVSLILRSGKSLTSAVQSCQEEVVKSLAWPLLIEAAMLSATLAEDIDSVAQNQGCRTTVGAQGLDLYMPDPSMEARAAFNDYVRSRWPIHVFALDPSTQEQNIIDAYSERRELQLTMSLAFLQGQISASDMMQFSRRLETDMETIALNRTVVGFSHGNDTFGWRFMPRLQSPPFKGNLAAAGETLFGPRKDAALLQRSIEPGMRECVALVIMPSFVPYVTVETRSSWNRLNAHNGWSPWRHEREVSMVDTMKLSRSIQAMHNLSRQLCDSQIYRPGDIQLMMNRVHQLDRSLPMQSMTTQVPIENTLGGFQLFNHGVTDLAPELRGWYGAPGIYVCCDPTTRSNVCCPESITKGGSEQPQPQQKPSTADATSVKQAGYLASTLVGDPINTQPASTQTCTCNPPANVPGSGTTLFLIGNHFSVHETQVIAGGTCLPTDHIFLLSPEVLRITIPGYVNTVCLEGERWVDIHVATPYGVTNHLHVPVISCFKTCPAKGDCSCLDENSQSSQPADLKPTPSGSSTAIQQPAPLPFMPGRPSNEEVLPAIPDEVRLPIVIPIVPPASASPITIINPAPAAKPDESRCKPNSLKQHLVKIKNMLPTGP